MKMINAMPVDAYLKEKSVLIERSLESYLPKASENPTIIHEAMRYAVLGNGKRLRPILTLAVNEMCGGSEEKAMIPACAVELIHTYSLVHDDLPLMDNDDMRRGKPSCHKKYGDAIALLTGDALLTLAFELLGKLENRNNAALLVRIIAEAAGTLGMIGGQVLDIQSVDQKLGLDQLDEINQRKTGALIQTSCHAGAIAGGANEAEKRRILKFGQYLGFAFQIVDDIIDRDGCLRFMSEEEAKKKAQHLTDQAKKELNQFGKAGEKLCMIADSILERKR